MARGSVAIVVKGYPRLSEAFIAHEIRALEERGLAITIISLRHPTDDDSHPVHGEITAPVRYLPEYVKDEPGRVFAAWRRVRRRARYGAALRAWLRDLIRDPTPNRVRRFAQAVVLADELPDDVAWLHAHFLHTPASVARYAALITGLKWSGSAHAKDIWTTPVWEKRRKLADCAWLVTCTAAAHDHLRALAPDPATVELVYHGLDPHRFPPDPAPRPDRDGSVTDDPAILLAVGRAVDKKAFDVLIDALAALPDGLNWRLVHVGGGALLRQLKRRAERRGISGRIDWLGPLPHQRIIERYRAADLFVLPLRIARDGDRDGLPNVLLEAQSQGLACIAGAVSGVPELIDDGATGILVAPEDSTRLAAAIEDLIRNPFLRRKLGRAARKRVETGFAFAAGIDRLARKFPTTAFADAGPACASHSTRR